MVEKLANSEANTRRIMMVENAFGSVSLQRPGRVLVGEGVLTKLCRKKPKPRQFFLFNDILVYGNIVISKKKYNKEHILALEDVQLVSLEDEGDQRHGWQIISPGKSFSVFAATATEKAEWMAHINKCVADLLKKTGRTGPGAEGAAVWVPDSVASTCMVCRKAKFTAINRRHHCRKCGILVCGNCSRNKWLLPQINAKPVRICNNCYAALRSGADPNDVGQVSKNTTASRPPKHEVLRPRDSVEDMTPRRKEVKDENGEEALPPVPPKQSATIKPNRDAASPQMKTGSEEDSSGDEQSAAAESVPSGSVASKFGSSDEEDDDDEPLQYEQEERATFFMEGSTNDASDSQ